MTPGTGPGLVQRLRPWRWTAQAAAIGLVSVLLLAIVFASPTERFCSSHRTGCGLVTGFISTTVIAIAGYFFIVVWTLRRAVPRYLEVALRTPERLLPTAGRISVDDIVARLELVTTVATELQPSRRGAPVLVVGAAGAGKTTFLLELTSRLAANHAVPVACTLRGAEPPIRLRAMARERFLDAVDALVRSPDHAERIWRRLCADGEIVVIADGLDELMPGRPSHERDQAIRQALAGARNDRLPVVVASRPETVPVGAHVTVFELEPLAKDGAVRYLEERIPARNRPDRSALEDFADLGRATPYYLEVIAALHRARSWPGTRIHRGDQLLVMILDSWIDLVVKQRLMHEVELDDTRRKSIVEGLGLIALAMTRQAALECDVAAVECGTRGLPTAGSTPRLPISAVVDGASRLDLVETFPLGESTGVRFPHAISQSYFLSRLLCDSPEAWNELIRSTPSAEMNGAFVMWCARDRDRGRASALGAALIERARPPLDADQSLLLLVTAGEIASAVGRDDFDALDGGGAWDTWSRASPRARLAAVQRLHGHNDAWSLRTLHERTRDSNYRVRWAAAQAVAAGGDAAWRVLGAEFARTVRAASERTDWTDSAAKAEIHDISVAGWILPALAPTLEAQNRAQACRRVETLVDLVPNIPAGTEASLAQGFKLDALTNRGGAVAAAVWTLLEQSEFWYSRVVLAHAACIRAIAEPAENGDALMRIAELARADEHPFVVAAARLCIHALRTKERTRWMWDDEIAIITRSGSMLDDRTARLLADVVLLLNLTEQGDPADDVQREQQKEDIYRRPGLPHCLAESRTRDEVFTGCPGPALCTFDLCPYPATADRALARGEFSEAFCRHQAEIAARRGSLPTRLARRRRTRWSRLAARDAARFWERMERRAF